MANVSEVSNVAWVAAAAVVGFVGNELVARFRISVGERIGSAALVADGQHARTDGFTSLAVLVGALGVWLGYPIVDPIVGLGITVAILFIVKDSALSMWRRVMDSVDPEVVKAPKDMVGWFRHHPYLDTEKPEPATVGGVKGVQFDYVVSEDAPYDDIDLFRYSDGSQGAAVKWFKYGAIVLEGVKGKTVTIGIGSETNEFDEFLPEAQKVLDTVKWTGS